jgi:RNA polymerase sigma-70 factor (ECF subfamily)
MSQTPPAANPNASAAHTAPLSDDELRALRNRKPDAVRRFIYERRDYIEAVLRRYSVDAEVARDLLQETFFQALRSLPNFRGESKITTWLHSIAKNVALARYRKNKRQSCLDEETLEHIHATSASGSAPTAYPDPVRRAERAQEKSFLYDAMDELSESYREVLQLRALEEKSTKEVAEELNLTRVNVRVRLHRARKALRTTLEGRFDDSYHAAA